MCMHVCILSSLFLFLNDLYRRRAYAHSILVLVLQKVKKKKINKKNQNKAFKRNRYEEEETNIGKK